MQLAEILISATSILLYSRIPTGRGRVRSSGVYRFAQFYQEYIFNRGEHRFDLVNVQLLLHCTSTSWDRSWTRLYNLIQMCALPIIPLPSNTYSSFLFLVTPYDSAKPISRHLLGHIGSPVYATT